MLKDILETFRLMQFIQRFLMRRLQRNKKSATIT